MVQVDLNEDVPSNSVGLSPGLLDEPVSGNCCFVVAFYTMLSHKFQTQ